MSKHRRVLGWRREPDSDSHHYGESVSQSLSEAVQQHPIHWRLPSIPPPPHVTNSCSIEFPPPIPIDYILSKERLSSTYREDYRSLKEQPRPPSYLEHYQTNMNTAANGKNVQSTTHHTYQLPKMANSLHGFTTRYECNKEMVFRATGILPTVNEKSPHCSMGIKQTQYTSDFGQDTSNLNYILKIVLVA